MDVYTFFFVILFTFSLALLLSAEEYSGPILLQCVSYLLGNMIEPQPDALSSPSQNMIITV